MTMAPHDITDLHLAPVLIALDARLEELGRLDARELSFRIALESNKADYDVDMRAAGLLESVRHFIDCHGWDLSWDPRGIRVGHGNHHVVLGVPTVVAEYVAGPTAREV
jgi:hypothetical protein